MNYAPQRVAELDQYPQGYVRPPTANLNYLQKPPEDTRKI